MSGYPAVYNPVYANPNDGENITLCKILDVLSLGTSGTNSFDVNVVPSIGNGLPSAYSFTSVNTGSSGNLIQVKTSAALLGTLLLNNTVSGTDYFVNIYDSAAATNTTTPKMSFRIQKGASMVCPIGPSGLNLNNGLAFGIFTTFGGTTLMNVTGVDVTLTYL